MRTTIFAGVLLGFFAAAGGALAQNHTSYRIVKLDHVLKTDPDAKDWKNHLWVRESHAWLPGQEQITATVAVTNDIAAAGVYLRAYFFDSAKALVGKAGGPADVRIMTNPGDVNSWVTAFATPQQYQHGTQVFAQFPVPKVRWATAFVVFGDADTAIAKAVPGGLPAEFDLPEKAQIAAGE